ncbi:DUF4272 domain-containing protein [Labrys monachus]|uniref:DUF4272 domain-containing protein n=1 Tax=Labrys monachus TaxID=217067 RepID=A0ABU0F7J0_9HYPH|nr:DUF4272 domain-containing protein [Labrys monachus]MDQ0390580.1 hypothetical protein [Labrys monachus]
MSVVQVGSLRWFDSPYVQDGDPLLINSYSTLRAPPEPDFPHELHNRRDRSHPEMVRQLWGFRRYVEGRGDGEMTSIRYHLLRHIDRTRVQFALTVEPRHLVAFAAWARRANTIHFLPVSSVHDPAGAVLIDIEGRTDDDAALPYPPDAHERKQRTLRVLAAANVKTLGRLPPVIGMDEVVLRPAREVAGRAMALMIVAAQAEAWMRGMPEAIPGMHARFAKGKAFLTGEELLFLAERSPDPGLLADMDARYEDLNLLLWALGHHRELSEPRTIADAAELAATVERMCMLPQTLDQASLRPTDEILDVLDYHYRLHWSVRQASLDNRILPGIDASIVFERHRALNWLTGFQNVDEPWDDVDTPT